MTSILVGLRKALAERQIMQSIILLPTGQACFLTQIRHFMPGYYHLVPPGQKNPSANLFFNSLLGFHETQLPTSQGASSDKPLLDPARRFSMFTPSDIRLEPHRETPVRLKLGWFASIPWTRQLFEIVLRSVDRLVLKDGD